MCSGTVAVTTGMTNIGQIESDYVHLHAGETAEVMPGGEPFWQALTTGELPALAQGRLVTGYRFERDWTSWERHPHGEEFVCLLSGAVDLLLEHPASTETVELRTPGSFLLVPAGIWHTATVHALSHMLFITPGRDTQHRPR